MKNQKLQRSPLTILDILIFIIVTSVIVANLCNIGDPGFRKWGMGAVLLAVVRLYILKSSLRIRQLTIQLQIPNDYKNKITWDMDNCFVILNRKEKKIGLSEADTSSDQVSLYLVDLADDLTEQILNTGTFEFKLKDKEGRNWGVTFSLYKRTKPLRLSGGPLREGELQ
jgi:hypothetical protein